MPSIIIAIALISAGFATGVAADTYYEGADPHASRRDRSVGNDKLNEYERTFSFPSTSTVKSDQRVDSGDYYEGATRPH